MYTERESISVNWSVEAERLHVTWIESGADRIPHRQASARNPSRPQSDEPEASFHYAWTLRYLKDGDIAVSPAALTVADLRMYSGVEGRIFMMDSVVEALKETLDPDFAKHRCKIV